MIRQAGTATPNRVRRPAASFIAALVLAAATGVPHAAPSPTIVISQVYGGGNNAGAPFG